MFRKQLYTWHRTLSLIIAIPVLLWAISGFMHPLMTNIKPKIASQKIAPAVIDSHSIQVALPDALQKNNIATFHTVRLIHIDTNYFYQVQQTVDKAPIYLSVTNGKLLPMGDWLYAQHLARQFLEGAPTRDTTTATTAIATAATEEEGHDCCNAATACVLQNVTGSKVSNVSRITSFNKEYKYVNRLLPVYQVSFNRADGIRVYVETTQDRFAFAMDNKRAAFDNIFQWMHTWSWLDALGNTKLYLIILICLMALTSSLLGIYIFFITKTKKPNGHALLKARRNHRYTAIIGALFTLAWSFSGAWHAFEKFETDDRDAFYINNSFTPNIPFNFAKLQQAVNKPIINLSLVQMNNQAWWRVITQASQKPATTKAPLPDKKTMVVPMPAVTFVHANDYSILTDGEEKYAGWLASQFSKRPANTVQAVTPVTKFTEEYNFTDKRLPVWKVSYNTSGHERYFVETGTSRLSVKVDDGDLAEGYNFAILHKHHFMDFGGKEARDISTMFWVLVQVVMVVIGLVLWYRKRAKS